MRLIVTDNPSDNVTFDVVTMSIGEFNDICSHPYIATANFDEVVIDVTDKVKLGHVRPVMSITRVIPKIPDEITSHTISVLSEIYPEKAAELRYTFIRNRDGVKDIIDEMCKAGHWKEFY